MCIARRFIIWPWPAPLLHSVKKFKLTFQIVQWTFKSEIMEVGSDDKVKATYDGECTIYRTPVSTQHTHLTSLWPGLRTMKLQIYRVFSKGRIDIGPPKSLIFWTFPGVLGFFWPFNMGDFSFWYFWGIWLKKKLKIL